MELINYIFLKAIKYCDFVILFGDMMELLNL